MMPSFDGTDSIAFAVTGVTLVRRFTEEQIGDTALERATKIAQEQNDASREEEETKRLRRYFENPNGDRKDEYFHQAEVARQALDKTCEAYFTEEKSYGASRLFGIKRKSSHTVANEALQQYVASDVRELRDVVEGLETKWRQKQSKAFGHLRSLCTTLFAHKKAFALLPTQNDYASSLCGGITLLISAAVNYDEIAEILSEKVNMIAAKLSSLVEIVDMIETQRMCELYAELHAHVFLFYRDAIAWYMERKRNRLFKSFNEQLKAGYEKAIERIRECMTALLLQTNVAKVAMTKVLLLDVQGLRREISQQRQEFQAQTELASAGIQMQNLLHAMVYSKIVGTAGADIKAGSMVPAEESGSLVITSSSVNRAAAMDQSTLLRSFVVGDEGQSLFEDGRFWIPHADASAMLVRWMDRDTQRARLWIDSPIPERSAASSRAAAITTVVAAWQSKEPIISHFCTRPDIGSVPDDQMCEEVGLIGLVYSLIIQMLEFRIEGDTFVISKEKMNMLDGSNDSWNVALQTFSDLLRATPQVSICVIDDLNVLSLSTGVQLCTEFLDALFDHQQQCAHVFRVLLTTAGFCSVIPEYFDRDERVFVQQGAQEVLRRDLMAIEPAKK